ncbi:hypothetical protein TL16_g11706 [Triparma laevis f. inornata]|uniref:FYVE-type domain-containing protein n=1 Tax=Triparma laevis f. inornata TaxID=1714386 RepID=A0A9W7BMB2_9STRA|nr:hypothetical protein TL16_g11706 [Triparma laevis f. inornata]
MLSNLIFGPSSAPSSFSSFPSPGTLPSSTSSPLSNDVRYVITDATPDGNVSIKALPRYIVPEEPASSSSDDGFTTDGSSSSSDPLLDILAVDEKDPNACDYYLQGEQQIYPRSPTPPMTTTTNTNNPKRRRSKTKKAKRNKPNSRKNSRQLTNNDGLAPLSDDELSEFFGKSSNRQTPSPNYDAPNQNHNHTRSPSTSPTPSNEEEDTSIQSNTSLWMPDSLCTRCYNCTCQFTLLRRRHHCRVCGQVFCSDCSKHSVERKTGGGRERACVSCFLEVSKGESNSSSSRSAKISSNNSTAKSKKSKSKNSNSDNHSNFNFESGITTIISSSENEDGKLITEVEAEQTIPNPTTRREGSPSINKVFMKSRSRARSSVIVLKTNDEGKKMASEHERDITSNLY